MKKLVYRPVFKHVLIELEPEKKEKSSLVDIPIENVVPFKKAKVLDYSRDCTMFQSLTSGQDRYVIIQSHMIEAIEIDGKVFHVIPENAIVMVSSEM